MQTGLKTIKLLGLFRNIFLLQSASCLFFFIITLISSRETLLGKIFWITLVGVVTLGIIGIILELVRRRLKKDAKRYKQHIQQRLQANR